MSRPAVVGRDVGLARPRRHPRLLEPHLELVLLVVHHRRGEAEGVERVQLLGDAREGGARARRSSSARSSRRRSLRPACAGRGRAACAARGRARSKNSDSRPDGVDHRLLVARALEHVAHAAAARRVVAVGEGHAPPCGRSPSPARRCSGRSRRRAGWGCRTAGRRSAPIRSSRSLVKVPLNWILSLNAPTCALSSGSIRIRNCSVAVLQAIEVGGHAGAEVQHHDGGERLHFVQEEGDFLRLAVVQNRELVALQARHQPPLRVGHRRQNRHDSRARSGRSPAGPPRRPQPSMTKREVTRRRIPGSLATGVPPSNSDAGSRRLPRAWSPGAWSPVSAKFRGHASSQLRLRLAAWLPPCQPPAQSACLGRGARRVRGGGFGCRRCW